MTTPRPHSNRTDPALIQLTPWYAGPPAEIGAALSAAHEQVRHFANTSASEYRRSGSKGRDR